MLWGAGKGATHSQRGGAQPGFFMLEPTYYLRPATSFLSTPQLDVKATATLVSLLLFLYKAKFRKNWSVGRGKGTQADSSPLTKTQHFTSLPQREPCSRG